MSKVTWLLGWGEYPKAGSLALQSAYPNACCCSDSCLLRTSQLLTEDSYKLGFKKHCWCPSRVGPPPYIKEQVPAQLPIHLKANFATAKQPPGFFEDPLGNPKSEPREAATRNTSQSPLLSILTALERIGANTSQHNITSSHHQFDLHVLQPNFSRRRNTENTDSWSQSKLQKSKL